MVQTTSLLEPQPGLVIKGRDLRVDAIRGAMLLMIFVDHCSGNIFAYGTLYNLQFSDASEMFFLLSGFSCMAFYGRQLDLGDIKAGLRSILRRCGSIYSVQIVLLIAAECLMVICSRLSSLHIEALRPLPGTIDQHIGIAGAQLFDLDFWNNLVNFLSMRGLPRYFDILRTYIVLLAVFPLLWLGLRRAPLCTFILSAGTWFAAHGNGGGLHIDDVVTTGPWNFNPFGWQFIFLCGAGLRVLLEKRRNLPRVPALLAISLAVILAGTAFQLLFRLGYQVAVPMMYKGNLSPVRVLDTLAIFYPLMCFDWSPRVLQLPVIRALRACGRQSLLVFSLGILMSLSVDLAFSRFGQDLTVQIIATFAGAATLVAAAVAADRRKKRQRYSVPDTFSLSNDSALS